MKQIELICSGCGMIFRKLKKEYDRQIRKGKIDFYCTRQCFGLCVSPKNLQTEKAIAWRNSDRNKEWLRRQGDRQRELFDPFRPYLKLMKNHRTAPDIDVDISFLKEIWQVQDGRCAYSGLIMEHPTWGATDQFKTASIDRIDSSKGYIRGNIQFIIRALNFAKNNASDDAFVDFLFRLSESLTQLRTSPK